ncbi:hypothetical protein KC19_VG142400 [Ceratodon purpureus]|uniref:Secreted protein n=1 Tax=Ceratodon purpureus TaxID=3225 RepID=A0A8T0HR50_CERPU|nr:hypothetical protein KC19_VG142400 [Ceratodon purpureus]
MCGHSRLLCSSSLGISLCSLTWLLCSSSLTSSLCILRNSFRILWSTLYSLLRRGWMLPGNYMNFSSYNYSSILLSA